MARNRRDTKFLFVHCSATKRSQDIGAKTINQWHTARGIYSERGLTGYHFIIRRNGLIELGRDLSAIGAHALGYNDLSVGICLVGGARKAKSHEAAEWGNMVSEDNFEPVQKESLAVLLVGLLSTYPDAVVVPHNAVSDKACPSFNVWEWQYATFGYDDAEVVARMLAAMKEGAEE